MESIKIILLIIVHCTFYIINCPAQWQQVNCPNNPWITNFSLYGTTILAGSNEKGLYKSIDEGLNWVQSDSGLPENAPVKAITYFDGDFYAGIDGGVSADYSVFRSTDNGETWFSIGWFSETVLSMVVKDQKVFVSFLDTGIKYTTDKGNSWVDAGLSGKRVRSLVTFDQYLFAGYWGVYKTTNDGVTWDTTGLSDKYIYDLDYSQGSIYAATSNGMYSSSDDGLNWNKIFTGGQTTKLVIGVKVINGYIFAATQHDGIFQSTDNGVNWSNIGEGLTSSILYSVDASNNYLFTTTNSSIWRRPLSELLTDVEPGKTQPAEFKLEQNYPNPFNPNTTISWQSPVSCWQTIKMFNSLGQEVETIIDGYYEAGTHSKLYIINSSMPSGVYFYQLKAGDFLQTRKMILMK